jgi:hypothetical protein
MKRLMLAAVCLFAVSVAVAQQHDMAAYQPLMKEVQAANGSLRKNVEAKNAAGIAADAKKLSDTFAKVHAYWQTRNVADATQFAADAQAAFAEAARLAEAGNVDGASAAVAKAAATCMGCHTAHRERDAAGAWTIK